MQEAMPLRGAIRVDDERERFGGDDSANGCGAGELMAEEMLVKSGRP